MRYNNPQQMVVTGQPTPQTVIYKSESHKLHQAFPVKSGEILVQGQPVKMFKDGTVGAYFNDDNGFYLGIAVTDSIYPAYPPQEQGYEVTVMVEGFAVIYGLSNGKIEAGPVAPAELSEDSQYVKYNQGVDGKFLAISTATVADELIQILVK